MFEKLKFEFDPLQNYQRLLELFLEHLILGKVQIDKRKPIKTDLNLSNLYKLLLLVVSEEVINRTIYVESVLLLILGKIYND